MEYIKRNSNLELLRIVCMYMIVFIHANMYLPLFCEGTARVFYNGLINGICNIGVTCFILISGYFGVKFSLKKILKMECMMISFSIFETIILCIVMPQEMQGAVLLEQVVKSCLPFITRKYWFYSGYVCLICLSAYINKFVDALQQDEFKKLLGILLVIFSIFPTFFYFEIIPDNGKGVFQMILIYLLGRYISKYGIQRMKLLSRGRTVVLFSLLWLINGISHEMPIRLGGIYHHLCKDNSITNILMAIMLFYFIKECEIKMHIINKISKHVFAIFALNNALVLIVMHLLNKYSLIHPLSWSGGFFLAFIVFFIMIICVSVGVMRECMLGRLENKLITAICVKCEGVYE